MKTVRFVLLALMLLALTYLEDPVTALAELARVLQPQGRAVLVTLLTPGNSQAAATVVRDGKNFLIAITIKGKTVKLRIRPDLTLL